MNRSEIAREVIRVMKNRCENARCEDLKWFNTRTMTQWLMSEDENRVIAPITVEEELESLYEASLLIALGRTMAYGESRWYRWAEPTKKKISIITFIMGAVIGATGVIVGFIMSTLL